MIAIDIMKKYVEYHHAMTRRVWDSIGHIREEQFLAEDGYSRGSIRNLMAHLANTDRRWLTGLKGLPDIAKQLPRYETYPDRTSLRAYWDSVAAEVAEYAGGLSQADLEEDAPGLVARGLILLHMINHGTDHRATVLQKLHALGAPTFDQDLVLWLWEQEQSGGNP
jgi:uncharacterized damage-inducible protein DinB